MSYTRRFSKTIRIRYSGSVSYPASQNGGSVSYSGYADETVNFDIHVDTDPFDDAVDDMKSGVDLLTGSVVATEAAQLKAIDDSSRKVGDTIVKGFFKTVRSDISQHITELRIKSESLLMQLTKLAERCRDKQRQMGADYQRLSERYLKIFTDLSRELENRIYSVDEPVFGAVRTLDAIGRHAGNEAAPATVSVTAAENARVHSMLAVNLTKKQAMDAIGKGRRFLDVQAETDSVIKKCLLPAGESAFLTTPFCVMETKGEKAPWRELHASPLLKDVPKETLYAGIDKAGWRAQLSESDIRGISDYFNQKVANQHQNANNTHDHRVADMTARLFNLSGTLTSGPASASEGQSM